MSFLKNMTACILLALLICGCAGHSKELLSRDHSQMTDDEILTYFYELSDEIDRCENASNKTSVGIGTGLGLGWLGIGLGLSQGVSACNPDELRQRRIEVRMELQHRGINP
ncbi:MAG: hypothetical protein JW920_11650 [Deltaproteobacteria bacterium]|nr:hypothetical protein [Deltaproteobacteria bacterium]